MMRGRMDKTHDKMRRGGLPAPTADRPAIDIGTYGLCDGCSDPITPMDRMNVVAIRNALSLRFHDECYSAWSTFNRN